MANQSSTISRRSLLRWGATAGIAGSALAACGSPDTTEPSPGSSGASAGPATLRFAFWGSDDRIRRFQEACELFTEKNPNIQIQPEFGAIDAIRTKTTVAMAAQNLPDVTWLLGDLFPQMVTDGHLLELTPYLDAGIATDGFSDSVLAPGIYDDKQYGLTHGLQSIGVFAKAPVLEELDIPIKTYPEAYTWEEYASYAVQAHEVMGDNFYGTDDPSYAGANNYFRAYARQRGQDLWSDTGDLGFTEDLLTEWLTYWKDLRDSQGTVPTSLALEQNPYFEGAPMIRGLAAFHMRNSNQILELQSLSSEPLVLLPSPGNGGSGNENIGLDPNFLGIASNTDYPDAAVKFVDFLLNDPDRAEIIGTTIGAPPSQAMRDVITPTVSESERQFLEYISFEAAAETKPIPAARPTAGAFQTGMTQAIETLAFDQATIEETITTIFGDLRGQLLA